jgi:hypothetical protein
MGRKASNLRSLFARVAPGCWEWGGARSATGYGWASYKDKTVPAHRLVWEMVSGPIPAGLFVLHHCDNPPCVRPDHLFLGTQADNLRDARAKGRRPPLSEPPTRDYSGYRRSRGQDHHAAKLSEQQVVEIRSKWATGAYTRAALAAEYGVVPETIYVIATRRGWKHVP